MRKFLPLIGSLALLAFLLPWHSASAHHPEVVAVATCSQGQAVITATATAWVIDEPARRVNNLVTVTDQVSTVSGAFLASNGYSFDVKFTVPGNGVTYTIRATAVDDWGPNGEYGSAGEFRETTVTVPTNCTNLEVPTTTIPVVTTVPPTTDTVPPIDSVVTRPPTTVTTTVPASTSTSTTTSTTVTTPTTTVPTADISIERPPTGPLAKTGINMFAYLGPGLIALCLGGLIVLGDKKLRKV